MFIQGIVTSIIVLVINYLVNKVRTIRMAKQWDIWIKDAKRTTENVRQSTDKSPNENIH